MEELCRENEWLFSRVFLKHMQQCSEWKLMNVTTCVVFWFTFLCSVQLKLWNALINFFFVFLDDNDKVFFFGIFFNSFSLSKVIRYFFPEQKKSVRGSERNGEIEKLQHEILFTEAWKSDKKRYFAVFFTFKSFQVLPRTLRYNDRVKFCSRSSRGQLMTKENS